MGSPAALLSWVPFTWSQPFWDAPPCRGWTVGVGEGAGGGEGTGGCPAWALAAFWNRVQASARLRVSLGRKEPSGSPWTTPEA